MLLFKANISTQKHINRNILRHNQHRSAGIRSHTEAPWEKHPRGQDALGYQLNKRVTHEKWPEGATEHRPSRGRSTTSFYKGISFWGPLSGLSGSHRSTRIMMPKVLVLKGQGRHVMWSFLAFLHFFAWKDRITWWMHPAEIWHRSQSHHRPDRSDSSSSHTASTTNKAMT